MIKLNHHIQGLILVIIFTTLCLTTSAQSTEYEIETFQDEYVELESYQSIAILTQGDPLWNIELPLNFEFPYFDSSYTRIFADNPSWIYFTEDQDLGLMLMFFITYTIENVTDTFNIPSDVRFSNVEKNGMQAFVMQFTKVRFFADPYDENHDTYLNYQIWLYENGTIEVHFGEMHMDNNPIYVPGRGFHTYDDNGIYMDEIGGPYMSITDPLDEDNSIGLHGTVTDYNVGTTYSILTELPPPGWVIRFKPRLVGIDNNNNYTNLNLSPNPARDFITAENIGENYLIIDVTGKQISEGPILTEIIDVSQMPSGLYFLQTTSKNSVHCGKFIKH